jgi:preprotein translocase subunit YajC
MLKAGDVVVTMSYPGLFTIVEVVGDDVKIADGEGNVKTVRASNVRRVTRDESPST